MSWWRSLRTSDSDESSRNARRRSEKPRRFSSHRVA
ncbi:Uncharacterised protein [Bordetella pertussis]|nr:Uncharacterised protein [Bordetella pertussis]CFW32613.1 Uncharacterised protein [Bordetella pertussis]